MYHAYFTTQILVTLFQTGYPDNWQKFFVLIGSNSCSTRTAIQT